MSCKTDSIAIQLVERTVFYFVFNKYRTSQNLPISGETGDEFELISRDVYDSLIYYIQDLVAKNDAATAKSILAAAEPEFYGDTDEAIDLHYGGDYSDKTQIIHCNKIIIEVINRLLRGTEHLHMIGDNGQPISYAEARKYAAGRHQGRVVICSEADKRIILFV